MILNYEGIKARITNGETYRSVWEDLGLSIKYETFRSAVRNYIKTGHERNVRLTSLDEFDAYAQLTIEEIKPRYLEGEELFNALKKGVTSDEIGPNPIVVSDIIDDLRRWGQCIECDNNGVYSLTNMIEKKTNDIVKDWDGTRHIKIGVLSDTHIGNKKTQMSFLRRLYDVYEEEGITDVYHVGDISDGWYTNRSDQVYELFAHGADEQVNYICENYPKKEGITTHFITGNHDYTFIRNTGYNIGPVIELKRPDLKYLGHNNARVWLTPNCDMEMNHPGDGSSYAMSYSIQKYIDSMGGGEKPRILLNGHHHKFVTMFYRNIHAIEVPCTEAQTNFMKSKRLAAHMGGLILDIHVTPDGTIEKFKVELIPLYKALENDY